MRKWAMQGSSKWRWANKCLILVCIVLVTTWISPARSRQRPLPSDPPNLFPSPQNMGSQEEVCKGRRVYMYDIPGNSSTDLLSLCISGLVPWIHFCKHYNHHEFGEPVNTTAYQNDWYRDPCVHARGHPLLPNAHTRVSPIAGQTETSSSCPISQASTRCCISTATR